MFDLEQAIAEWRRKMIAAGIKTPVPLEELENHLREEMETQMRSGLAADRAFALAVERIGDATRLREEFEKAADPFNVRMRKRLRAFAFFCALAFPYTVLPIQWIIFQRQGKIEITGLEWFLAFGSIIPTLLFIPAGRFVARHVPVTIKEWLMALVWVTVLFVGAVLMRLLWSVLWADSLVHVQILLLWTMSPWLGTAYCLSEWCDRCTAARRQSRAIAG